MKTIYRLIAAITVLLIPTALVALDLGQLKGAVYKGGNRNLVVILHGDGGPRDDFSSYAKSFANSTTTAVALTRPGFSGANGRSAGENPDKDHYTNRNNKLLAQSLQAMKADLGAENLVVMGHSGGAAMTAIVIGRFPGIVDNALLLGCPCDVPNWRIHRRGSNGWKKSQSPHRFASKIPSTTTVVMITGADDENTLPRFAKKYAGIALGAGADLKYFEPAGVSHKWSTYRPHATRALKAMLK